MADAVVGMKKTLCNVFRTIDWVSTTTDCWSARGRSYIGVTAHWINPETMCRGSAALACRRLKGSHTYDVLAGAIDAIHGDYSLRQKVCKSTTDSGSNFVKAFSVFATRERDEAAENDDDSDTEEEEGDITYVDVGRELDASDDGDYQLPSHQRCACHTLQLVATTDADRAEADAPYKKLSRATFGKCQALWNKAGRSVLSAEAVLEICGMALVRPNQTRWNSLFFAVERLVRIGREKGEEALHSLCAALNVPRLVNISWYSD